MLNVIKGLHHVASMAADARRTKGFVTEALGPRRLEAGKARLVPLAG